MVRRVLVANRGEIALRIIRACRELAVESVAVFSDADRHAPHVLAADRAVHVGAAPAVESYLAIERILDAARASGADAVHPGYGFLSENAIFADACRRAGLIFVGVYLKNPMPLGSPGHLLSSGMMPLNSIAVGLEVAGGFLLIWTEFLDQTMIASPSG